MAQRYLFYEYPAYSYNFIYQATSALYVKQLMTSFKLLHVSAPTCHLQEISRTKAYNRTVAC